MGDKNLGIVYKKLEKEETIFKGPEGFPPGSKRGQFASAGWDAGNEMADYGTTHRHEAAWRAEKQRRAPEG